ncbi:hypothetical protein IWQ61_000381 [Dispira simplex]|nr:hypothetical protein IWQ61_000381 [Dispira simplex]
MSFDSTCNASHGDVLIPQPIFVKFATKEKVAMPSSPPQRRSPATPNSVVESTNETPTSAPISPLRPSISPHFQKRQPCPIPVDMVPTSPRERDAVACLMGGRVPIETPSLALRPTRASPLEITSVPPGSSSTFHVAPLGSAPSTAGDSSPGQGSPQMDSMRHTDTAGLGESSLRKRNSNNHIWSDADAEILLNHIIDNLHDYHNRNKTEYYKHISETMFRKKYRDSQVKNKITSLKKGFRTAKEQMKLYVETHPNATDREKDKEFAKIREQYCPFYDKIETIFDKHDEEGMVSGTGEDSSDYPDLKLGALNDGRNPLHSDTLSCPPSGSSAPFSRSSGAGLLPSVVGSYESSFRPVKTGRTPMDSMGVPNPTTHHPSPTIPASLAGSGPLHISRLVRSSFGESSGGGSLAERYHPYIYPASAGYDHRPPYMNETPSFDDRNPTANGGMLFPPPSVHSDPVRTLALPKLPPLPYRVTRRLEYLNQLAAHLVEETGNFIQDLQRVPRHGENCLYLEAAQIAGEMLPPMAKGMANIIWSIQAGRDWERPETRAYPSDSPYYTYTQSRSYYDSRRSVGPPPPVHGGAPRGYRPGVTPHSAQPLGSPTHPFSKDALPPLQSSHPDAMVRDPSHFSSNISSTGYSYHTVGDGDGEPRPISRRGSIGSYPPPLSSNPLDRGEPVRYGPYKNSPLPVSPNEPGLVSPNKRLRVSSPQPTTRPLSSLNSGIPPHHRRV